MSSGGHSLTFLLLFAFGTGIILPGATGDESTTAQPESPKSTKKKEAKPSVIVAGKEVSLNKDIKLKLNVNKKFSYLGIETENLPGENDDKVEGNFHTEIIQEKHTYLTNAVEETEKQILFIHYESFKAPRWYFSDNIYERFAPNTVIDKGKLALCGVSFKYVVHTSDKFMVKTTEKLLGVSGGKRLTISYIEFIPKALLETTWNDPSVYTGEQRGFIVNFNTNAREALQEAPL